MTNPNLAHFMVSLLAEELDKLIQILPLGEARIRDGRKLFSDESDLKRIADDWLSRSNDVAILYQHGDDPVRGWEAAGWIRKLFIRDDGLYAEVEWIDEARDAIRAKKWKYVSPGVFHDTDAQGRMRPKSLQEVSLTNIPAIDGMQKVAASEARPEDVTPEPKKEAPMPDPTPTPAAPALDITALAAKVSELLTPTLAAQLAEATGREVETRLSAIRRSEAVTAAVDGALGSGRIVAAAKPHAVLLAQANVEAFSALVATLPVQTPNGAISGTAPEPKIDPAATPKDRRAAFSEAAAFRSRVAQYAARHGMSEAAASAFIKAETAAAN